MADELGKFQVGVELRLDKLASDAADAKRMLAAVEASLKGIAASSAKTTQAVTGFGAKMVALSATMNVVSTAIHAVVGAFHSVERALATVERAFDETVGSAARFSNHLESQAKLLGIGTERMQELSMGLRLTGAGAEAGTMIFRRLSMSIGSMVGKGREGPAEVFKRMKISVIDAQSHLRNTADVLDEFMKKLLAMPEGARQYDTALAVLGRTGGSLLTMFRDLKAEGSSWTEHLRKMGLIIDSSVIAAASSLEIHLQTLKAQSDTTWTLIGAAAAPAFVPLLRQIENIKAKVIDWVKSNMKNIRELSDHIAEKLGRVIEVMEDLGKTFMDFAANSKLFQNTWDAMGAAVDIFLIAGGAALNVVDGLITGYRVLNAIQDNDWSKAWDLLSVKSQMAMASEEIVGIGKEGIKTRGIIRDTSEELNKLLAEHPHTGKSLMPPVKPSDQEKPGEPLSAHGSLFSDMASDEAVGKRVDELLRRLHGDTSHLTDANRKRLESEGHLAPATDATADATKKRTDTETVQSAASVKANEAVQKMIDSVRQEAVQLTQGVAAKIHMQLATKELAGHSEALEKKLIAETLALQNLQAQLAKAATLMGIMTNYARTSAQAQLALDQQELELAKQKAEEEGNDADIIKLTGQIAEKASQGRLETEANTISDLVDLENMLADERGKLSLAAGQKAIELGLVVRQEGEGEVENLKTDLAAQLAARREHLEEVKALEEAKVQAAKDAAQRAIDHQRSALLDLKGVLGSTINDMFEGIILGTKKTSEVWHSMWQSMAKTGIQTLKDMVLNKITALDKPLELNFATLPGKLMKGFEKLKPMLDEFWANVDKDAEAVEAGGGGMGGLWENLKTKIAKIWDKSGEGEAAGATAGGGASGMPEVATSFRTSVDTFRTSVDAFAAGLGGGGGAGPLPGLMGPPEAEKKGSDAFAFMTPEMFGGGEKTKKDEGIEPIKSTEETDPFAALGGGQKKGKGEKGGGGSEAEGGGATDSGGIGAAMAELGGVITDTISGLGKIFTGVGDKSFKPLKPLDPALKKGFHDTGGKFKPLAKDVGGDVKEAGSKGVHTALAVGGAVGSGLSLIGGLIGGKAGAILSIIGEIISFLVSMIVILIYIGAKILGTGGYINKTGGLTRASGTGGSQPTASGIFKLHPGEGVINAAAMDALGGKAAAMDLNKGIIPRSMAAKLGEGLLGPGGTVDLPTVAVPVTRTERVLQMIVPQGDRGPAKVDSRDQRVMMGPGAITVNAQEGVDGVALGRDLMRGILTTYGR